MSTKESFPTEIAIADAAGISRSMVHIHVLAKQSFGFENNVAAFQKFGGVLVHGHNVTFHIVLPVCAVFAVRAVHLLSS